MGLFSKKTTFDPMSQYTPQQRQSIEALMSLAATGSGGGITLGQKYGGDLGAYDLTDQTKGGLASLQALLGGAYDPNSDMGQARSTYQNLANNSIFDLESDQSGYKAFSKALAKSGQESADVLNREAAMTGQRFGTGIQRQKADLAENLQLQRAQQLANLYQGSQQVAALGAQGLTGLADQVAKLSGLNITYGDMQREMEDARAKEQYGEFLRTRQEELSRLGLMSDQWQNPMGTITTKGPSMFAKMLGTVSPIMGEYNTQKYGYSTGQQSIGKTLNAMMSMASMGGFGGASSSGSMGSMSTGSISSNPMSSYGQNNQLWLG